MKYLWDEKFKGIVCVPSCTDEYLQLICEIAVGYDGCSKVDSLKELIDEMADYAKKAHVCLRENKNYPNKYNEEESLEEATKKLHEWELEQDAKKAPNWFVGNTGDILG